MKTREELLKEMSDPETIVNKSPFLDNWNVQRKLGIDGVKDILQAPTQEQLDCPYCHGGRKAKPIVEEQFSFLAFDKNGIVALGNDGSVTTGEDYERFMFCPMCGRKLGDD